MTQETRVRLCLKDLYHQDVVEMIERETRRYELHSIESPDHPDFDRAYTTLWRAFGAAGEMEPRAVIDGSLRADRFTPLTSGTYARYFMLVARDATGQLRGVRDGCVLVNRRYSPDLCLVYLSHIFMLPEARGTVLTYWLRIAPVELAVQYLQELIQRGAIAPPAPDAPGKYFGMRLNLAAEMEYFSPEDKQSLQRILFYGRGGFDTIDPRHFPYRQPDFRDPELIRTTGDRPVPFMLLVRRMGREREARMPIDEAAATMRLLYDDFARFCAPEFLTTSLDVVLGRLEERRAKGKPDVALLPLPTGAHDLSRLRRFFRYDIYQRYYDGGAIAPEYMSRLRQETARDPHWLDHQLARLAGELDTPHFVYGHRDASTSWDGTRIATASTRSDESEVVPKGGSRSSS